MGAKASDKVLVTGQLMYLVERLRSVQGFYIKQEIPDDKGGVVFQMGHSMSWLSWGENISVNINFQVKPKSNPPIRFGIKNRPLKKLFPLNFCVTIIAKKRPIRFIKIMLKNVTPTVNHKDFRKCSSFVNI